MGLARNEHSPASAGGADDFFRLLFSSKRARRQRPPCLVHWVLFEKGDGLIEVISRELDGRRIAAVTRMVEAKQLYGIRVGMYTK